MFRKPAPNMRQLSAFVCVFVVAAVAGMGWAVWYVVGPNGARRSGVQDTTLAAGSSPSATSATAAEAQANSSFIGAPAPDFSLTVFDTGETLTLSGLRGQPVMLDFFASWCPSCRAEAPRLQEFWQAYAGRGLILLGVALNDSEEGLRAFKDDFLLTYPMGLDKTGEIAARYRIGSIPSFVLIDREGRIANITVGSMSEEAMTAEVEATLR